VPGDPRSLTRDDLPDQLTPEAIRQLPLSVLRRLSRPGNGVLDAAEQETFDAVLHEVMSDAAGRVSRQINPSDWAAVRRDLGNRDPRSGRTGRPARVDEQLRRMARRIDRQVDVAEALAPGVDWSFVEPGKGAQEAGPVDVEHPADGASGTVSDLEQNLAEQVELIQVMSEIADVSKRTYALEQQRDLQTTRGVFFGFVVSVAVLVAGWAPLVAAEEWSERIWILGLTLATCAVAGLVYALVRRRQNRLQSRADEQPAAD